MAQWFPDIDTRADFRQSTVDKKIDILADSVKSFTDFLVDENEKHQQTSSPTESVLTHPEKPSEAVFQFDFGALVNTKIELMDIKDKNIDKKALCIRLAEEVYRPLSRLEYPNLSVNFHRLAQVADDLLNVR
jgi:hypothetical protein